MTMLERCTKAIDKVDHRKATGMQDLSRMMARAVIEEMREPTKEMIKAGTIGWDPMDGSPIKPMFEPTKPYQKMIDEALK